MIKFTVLIKVLVLSLITVVNTIAQDGEQEAIENLIANPSFEEGSDDSRPDDGSQVEFLNDWEDRLWEGDENDDDIIDTWIHSPDWCQVGGAFSFGVFTPDPVITASGLMEARTGTHYISMVNHELIQQQLSEVLIPGLTYRFSMFIQLTDRDAMRGGIYRHGASSLRVYLSKHKMRYRDESGTDILCTTDYVEHKNNTSIDLLDVELNLDDFPYTGVWVELITVFVAPEDGKYDWLTIEVERNDFEDTDNWNTDCHNSNVIIDDVDLRLDYPCCPDFMLFEDGMKLMKICRTQLDEVENRITTLVKENDEFSEKPGIKQS